MTKQQIELLQLGITPIDDRVVLIVGSALEWLQKNTILNIDLNNDETLKALPNCARLFIVQYFDLNMLSTGVSSESISGLSQSFNNNKSDLLWQIAEELLGDYLKSKVSFVAASSRWE